MQFGCFFSITHSQLPVPANKKTKRKREGSLTKREKQKRRRKLSYLFTQLGGKGRGYIVRSIIPMLLSINPQRNGRRSHACTKGSTRWRAARDRCCKKSPFPRWAKGWRQQNNKKKSPGRQPKKGGAVHWPSIASARCVQVEYTGKKNSSSSSSAASSWTAMRHQQQQLHSVRKNLGLRDGSSLPPAPVPRILLPLSLGIKGVTSFSTIGLAALFQCPLCERVFVGRCRYVVFEYQNERNTLNGIRVIV